MRILFVSPSNAIGGAELSMLQMAKYLHQKGHTVFVAMPHSTDKAFEQILQPFIESFLFVPLMAWNRIPGLGFYAEMKRWLYRFYKSRGGWLQAPFRIARFVRRHKIELIHTNTIMALDGAFAAKIAGVPHIQHLREITGYGPGALFPMLGQRWPRAFGKLWVTLHKGIIANSFYTKEVYAAYISATKIRVMYNMVETDDRCASHPLAKSVKTFGMVANVTSKVKNHRSFIQLAGMLNQTLPDLDFVIFGKMPAENDPYLQALQDEIAHQNISDKLNFRGLCTDTAELYANMDVLFHPYPFESFGRIFIEAMAQSVPVVAARGGGADELIKDGENGFLFDANDLESAVCKIRNLCEDRPLYDRIVKNGRAFARQFQSEIAGEALLEVYRGIRP